MFRVNPKHCLLATQDLGPRMKTPDLGQNREILGFLGLLKNMDFLALFSFFYYKFGRKNYKFDPENIFYVKTTE